MARYRLIEYNALAPGDVVSAQIGPDATVALYNLNGEFFATDDRCTHGNASLSEGDIEGDDIVCPFHDGAFDIRSGEPTRAPCSIPLKTYRVVVEEGTVFVEQDSDSRG